VQVEKRVKKGRSGMKPRFYGGPLLKVQSKRLVSGDFLPKPGRDTTKRALCVCFVAIL
jgi:hypothetical protein